MSYRSEPAALDPAGAVNGIDVQDLWRVFDAARRFIACRELASALASGTLPPPANLAEAIERDFVGFDLTRAERELRDAVLAAAPAIAAPDPVFTCAARAARRSRRRTGSAAAVAAPPAAPAAKKNGAALPAGASVQVSGPSPGG